MKLEVLLSCMNQKNFNITKNININSDILIVNQCNENKYLEKISDNNNYRMIKTTKRGISQSRNELLNNMNGDIGIFCDDDVTYYNNYKEVILKAFEELKDADIIIFDTEIKNTKEAPRKKVTKIRRSPKHKNYGSVRIAFKKESFYKNNLSFNLNFGTGSKYSSGEESLLLREANKKKMKIYEYPAVIAEVDYSNSSWFTGYNEKYFYDKGAWVKVAYPKIYFLLKWYFLFRFLKQSNLSLSKILENINAGIKGYKLNLSFEEYNKKIKRI